MLIRGRSKFFFKITKKYVLKSTDKVLLRKVYCEIDGS